VQPLLDAVVDYLPSPLEVDAVKGEDDRGNEAVRQTSDSEPLCAIAFKVMTDPEHGNTVLTFVRVYSGVLKAGSHVWNSTRDMKERCSRMLKLQGNSREDVTELCAGDIGAVIGFKSTITGDTLCDENHPIILEGIVTTEPVISQAIEPKKRDEQDKLTAALAKIALEDPSFKFSTDKESGQLLISGQGTLHLEIKVDILLRTYKCEVTVGMPQVNYRETVRGNAHGVGKFVRQSGGNGMYGHAEIDIEPLPRGTGFEFVDETVGGVVPKQYIGSVEKGIRETLENGAIAGYPVLDVKVSLVHGSYHEVDSNDQAFKVAGSMAFKDAFLKARPTLLEPIMELSVEAPAQYMGDVIGEVSVRRGKVQGTDINDDTVVVTAHVPLKETFDFTPALRQKTQGRGVASLTFSHYEPVPDTLAKEIIAEAGK
jgi:elongation factor G